MTTTREQDYAILKEILGIVSLGDVEMPPNHGKPWTAEDDAFLLADNGLTVEQKAVELGRTRSGVFSRQALLAEQESSTEEGS